MQRSSTIDTTTTGTTTIDYWAHEPTNDNTPTTTTATGAHVERAKDSLRNIHGDNLSSGGVFMHPSRQLVSLKVAREELNKAIALMEQTRWAK